MPISVDVVDAIRDTDVLDGLIGIMKDADNSVRDKAVYNLSQLAKEGDQ